MPTLTTHPDTPDPSGSTLHVALDLGNSTWCLACAPAVSTAPRVRVLQRRIGIVAVARRLIALWRFVETGRVPEGATLKA